MRNAPQARVVMIFIASYSRGPPRPNQTTYSAACSIPPPPIASFLPSSVFRAPPSRHSLVSRIPGGAGITHGHRLVGPRYDKLGGDDRGEGENDACEAPAAWASASSPYRQASVVVVRTPQNQISMPRGRAWNGRCGGHRMGRSCATGRA